ncbi:MAG: hypothetical protein JNM46_08925 [Anaerolineales bacterium]|nr:hypothetical protein [Anaerolineales bacterium]
MQLNKNIILNRYIIIVGIFAFCIAIGLYAYLGSFSRYIADDYCETVRMSSTTLINAVVERYSVGAWRAANRYSNILFVGLSEMLGENAMQVTIAGMVSLWAVGLIWSIYEARRLFNIHWNFHFDLLLGVSLAFFSLLQAPHLFQTIYWRSAMMTHFAPLVFGSFLFAFAIRQIRSAESKLPSWLLYVFVFISAFILAGFSEPPTATAVTALLLTILAIFYFIKSPIRKKALNILVWIFVGTFTGLMVMILSPANTSVAQERGVNIFQILSNSFFYSYLFIVDSLKTQPLPTLISTLIPFLLIWLYQQSNLSELSLNQKRIIWITIFAIPFLLWLLIAASFSPSVYGQSFPIERARFLARLLMIVALMLAGGLFGLLAQKIQFKPNLVIGQWLALTMLAMTSIVYPLRTAYYLFTSDMPEYRERAELWDLRDAFIRRHAAQGETDIAIVGFSGVYGIKEIDDNPNHWVNVCAARYYEINSIRAFGAKGQDIIELLSK